jgi:hypothetical protein
MLEAFDATTGVPHSIANGGVKASYRLGNTNAFASAYNAAIADAEQKRGK